MNEFLSSWYGILTIVLFDVVALVAVICMTYRWLFKHIFDCLVSGICLVLTSPLFLAVFIRGKLFMKNHEGAIEGLTETYYRVGKKEKLLKLKKFRSRDNDGDLLGAYGKWIENKSVPFDINNLPLPEREYFYAHFDRYRYLELLPCAHVRTAYCCPYRCRFCYRNKLNCGVYSKRYHHANVEPRANRNYRRVSLGGKTDFFSHRGIHRPPFAFSKPSLW